MVLITSQQVPEQAERADVHVKMEKKLFGMNPNRVGGVLTFMFPFNTFIYHLTELFNCLFPGRIKPSLLIST